MKTLFKRYLSAVLCILMLMGSMLSGTVTAQETSIGTGGGGSAGPLITPSALQFDMNNPASANVVINPGETLSEIKAGTALLKRDVDYTLSGNTVNISSYFRYIFSKWPSGMCAITINMMSGRSATLNATKRPELITPATLQFDMNDPASSNVVIKSGETLSEIKAGTALLKRDVDYTVSGNTVNINSYFRYIFTKWPNCVCTITINMSSGKSAILQAVKKIDLITPSILKFDMTNPASANVTLRTGETLSEIKAGTVLLKRDVDYTVSGNTLNISSYFRYIFTKWPACVCNITINTASGKTALLQAAKKPDSNTITPAAVKFDMSNPSGVSIAIKSGETLSDIKCGTASLKSGTDYTISNNTVNISKNYFYYYFGKFHQNCTLTFVLSGGSQILTVTPLYYDSVLSSAEASFNINSPLDLSVGVSFKGNTLLSIKNPSATLTAGKDYIISGSTVIIKSSYLSNTSTAETLTFHFSAGNDSVLTLKPLSVINKVDKPCFTPVGATYATEQAVTITSATVGAQIRYTIDGTTPTSNSALYTGPINISKDTTINAYAFKVGMADSETVCSAYKIQKVSYVTDCQRPYIKLNIIPTIVNLGQKVSISVDAADDIGVASKILTVNGNEIMLDSSGKAEFTSNTAGVFKVEAKAFDAAGNEGYSKGEILFSQSGDAVKPQVSISSPSLAAVVSSPAIIMGTASDQNLINYVLEYSLKDENRYTKFSEGTSSITNGELGVLDPTIMKNGVYDIRLTACDKGGNTSSTVITLLVQSRLKKGAVNLDFNDMTVPANGMSLDAVRSYNSSDKTKGDFGIGWSLNTSGMRLYKSGVNGENWELGGTSIQYMKETKPHYIAITYPDGRLDLFSMEFEPNRFYPASIYELKMVYKPQGSTKSTLIPLSDSNCYVYENMTLGVWANIDFDDTVYNPERYQLTTKEGTVIVFNKDGKVESIKDCNGNQLTITANGITHSNGRNLKFTRDLDGRIIKVEDNKGNAVTYSYDYYGDLVSVKDLSGNTTRYIYDQDHHLINIIDPRNISIVRNEYDEKGRLKASFDAGGNITKYIHDDSARKEIVENRLGNRTVLEYDNSYNLISTTDACGNKTLYTYDDKGNKITETNSLNSYTYSYDSNNNLVSKADSLGNKVELTYNSCGKILTMKDMEGNLASNTYDASGNLIENKDPASKSVKLGRDSKGNISSLTDQLGKKVQFAYDAKGNVVSQTDDLGNVVTFAYDDNGRCVGKTTTMNIPQGTKTYSSVDVYDSMGRVIQSTDAEGGVSKAEYNSIGKISAYTDRLMNRKEFEYDIYGNLSLIRYSDGTTESFTYNAEGLNTSAADREGKITRFEYDALGRVIKTIYPNNTSKTIEYDALGNITKQTDQRGNSTTYQYDAEGRNTLIKDCIGNITKYVYEKGTNPAKMIDARGKEYLFAYDANGRRTKTTFPDSTSFSTIYDDAGRIASQADQAGHVTSYEYDYAGRLVSVKDSLLNIWKYQYDSFGNITKVTDPNLNETAYEYDNIGRIIKVTLPMGMSETMKYNAEGDLISRTDFNGNTTMYSYDDLGKLKEKIYPDKSAVKFEYTSNGYIKSVTDSKGICVYQYNDISGLVKQVNPDGSSISYSYDEAGNCTEVKTEAGATSYSYDELGRVKAVTGADGVTTYAYDAVGNKTSTAYPNGVTTKYTYDDMNRLIKVESLNKGGQTLSSYEYTVGPAGERTKVTENTGRIVDYEYDNIYRLTKETIKSADGSTKVISYTYDGDGNRITKNDNGTVTTYKYDKNNRLTNEGSITYSYDNNGSLVLKSNGNEKTEYTYDFDNRLKKVKLTNIQGISTEEYEYDWQGNRIQKTVNDVAVTKYLVDSNKYLSSVVEERDGSGKLQVYYTIGDGELISQKRGAIVSYYLYDGHGSVRALSDSTGAITDTYTYDAFGNIISKTGNTANSYLYAGEQYDSNTGFYYLRARYMNPASGRFITMDTYAGSIFDPVSLHKYLYANASPVNYTDPTGNESLGELMVGIQIEGILGSTMQCFLLSGLRNALIGAVAGAVFGGVDAALGGAKGWDIVNAAINGSITGAEFGALATFAELRPLLAIMGVGSGIDGVEESLKNGNYAQAAERALVLSLALKSLKTDLFDTTKTAVNNSKSIGKAFDPKGKTVQEGVDPNTLKPGKKLDTLDPTRQKNAVKYGGDKPIIVDRNGNVLDGHHRLNDAIKNGRAVDVQIGY